MSTDRLSAELTRVFGDPPVAPRAVVRVHVSTGQGVAAGQEEADRLVDAGVELVVLDSELDGPGVPAAVAALLELEPLTVVGTTPGPGWRERVVAVRTLLLQARGCDATEIPDRVEDPALGRLVGLLDRLAARRTPVLLGSGTGTAAAALVAAQLQPDAPRLWLAGAAPVDEAGTRALAAVGLVPLLDLGLTRGSADVAVAVVRTGLELLGA